MYHLGKVIEVYRPSDKDIGASDASVQATLHMWDDNVLTMLVAQKLADKIKAGQTVLVDYRPDKEYRAPVPAHTIVKILGGKKGEESWKAYREIYDKQRKAAQSAAQPAQSYIG